MADLLHFGLSPEEAAEALDKTGNAGDCEVLPENWKTFMLYTALETQWDRGGMTGIRTGIKYDRIDVVLRGRPDIATADELPDIFPRLQLMERATLKLEKSRHGR